MGGATAPRYLHLPTANLTEQPDPPVGVPDSALSSGATCEGRRNDTYSATPASGCQRRAEDPGAKPTGTRGRVIGFVPAVVRASASRATRLLRYRPQILEIRPARGTGRKGPRRPSRRINAPARQHWRIAARFARAEPPQARQSDLPPRRRGSPGTRAALAAHKKARGQDPQPERPASRVATTKARIAEYRRLRRPVSDPVAVGDDLCQFHIEPGPSAVEGQRSGPGARRRSRRQPRGS